jgi:hypothetical protein
MGLTAITQTDASPADDATGVWVNQPTLSVLLNITEGGNMNGTITCVTTGDTYTITNQPNGTQTLTFPSASLPLEATTTHQWWVNVSNSTGVWVNTSYNFTTGSPARLSENTGFSATQLVLIGVLTLAMILVVLFVAMDMIHTKKVDAKKLMTMLIAVIIMVIALGFI